MKTLASDLKKNFIERPQKIMEIRQYEMNNLMIGKDSKIVDYSKK